MIYLDWAATAMPRDKEIKESLDLSLKLYGNPSSLHNIGISAKNELERCRLECSKLLNCSDSQLFFTSGATESNNLVLLSFLKKHTSGEIITTSIEHPSIIEPISSLNKYSWKIKNIDPDSSGKLILKKLIKSINDKTKIISIIQVHNETGVIQPIDEIVKIIRDKEQEYNKKIHIHVDGVQAVGKVDINLEKMGIDSFSISGHKFGAPKGVGILYLKNSRDPLYRGGGQERGIRPGTENIFAITAITKCLKSSLEDLNTNKNQLNKIMEKMIMGVRELGVSTIPKSREPNDKNFVPNILSLTAPPLPGEVIARVLNDKGFMISTGSACSSNKKSNTKGILSMGISKDEGFSSFRVSIGRKTSFEDIDNFLKALKESLKELAP